jgi:hypothetical protein
MADNLVINNSDHNFSSHADNIRASDNQPKVVPTPGTDAAQAAHLRSQLESGALTSAGSGLNAEYSA